MPFYASAFQYDDIPSETYNIFLSQIDASGGSSSVASASLDILSQKIFRRPVPYFYGATPSPNLSFPVSVTSPDEIDADTYRIIQKWLFSNRSYKKLLIFQEDMQDIYFNCFFIEPEMVRVGNIVKGLNANVVCDSPYAWQFPNIVTYGVSDLDKNLVYNNTSDDRGAYVYPKIVITMSNIGGDFSITNESDSDRVFSFTGLAGGEVITVDNSLQTISSSTGLKRLSNFNKKFFRLIPDINILHMRGNAASVTITSNYVSKKVG